MKRQRLADALKPRIIEALQGCAMTTADLAVHLNQNYYTVRSAIIDLENEGRVTSLGGSRNIQWTTDEPSVNNNTIPILQSGKERVKLITILKARFASVNRAAEASERLPMHITRLFATASRLAEGDLKASVSLNPLKIAMEEDRQALQRAIDFYNEVLDNPLNWDAFGIQTWPQDTSWDQNEVDAAIKHYLS